MLRKRHAISNDEKKELSKIQSRLSNIEQRVHALELQRRVIRREE
jgi:hypothetical protein